MRVWVQGGEGGEHTHTHCCKKQRAVGEKKLYHKQWWVVDTSRIYVVVIRYNLSEAAQAEGTPRKYRLKRCMRSWVYGAHTHSHNKHKIPLNIMNRMVSMVVHSFQFDFCNGYSGPKANRPKRSTIRSRLSHGTFHFIKCECA